MEKEEKRWYIEFCGFYIDYAYKHTKTYREVM
nr:MAG TPA: hypothetical protein [Caudoviricetes sp.]